jgi:hypothetical protein
LEGIARADQALVERVLATSGVERTPVPPEGSYLQELGQSLQQWVLDLLKESSLLALPGVALIGIVLLVAVLVVGLLLWVVLPRLRARRAKPREEEVGALTAAVGVAPASRDVAAWRAELDRRLAEGKTAEALEAAWWWLARSVAGPRVEPDWTSRDLLAQVRREDLYDVVRRLDVLTYGPQRPELEEVRTLVGRLEAVLA